MEASKYMKRSASPKNKWTIKKNRELLQCVNNDRLEWEIVAERLEFSVKECKQQLEFLVHSDIYTFTDITEEFGALEEVDPFVIPDNYQEIMNSKEKRSSNNDKKKKRRSVKKSTLIQFVVRTANRYVPMEYGLWSGERRRMWDEIPFSADEYYLKYLPPAVHGRSSEWTEDEKRELLETVKCYPPNGKWGLFSLHFLGRVGDECRVMYELLQVAIIDNASVERVEIDVTEQSVEIDVTEQSMEIDMTEQSVEIDVTEQSMEIDVTEQSMEIDVTEQSVEIDMTLPPPDEIEWSSHHEHAELKEEELMALTELLPEPASDDSLAGSGESEHSWCIHKKALSPPTSPPRESHLMVHHNLVFSDSDRSSPVSPEREVEAASVADSMKYVDSLLVEALVKSGSTEREVDAMNTVLLTPPRPSHKRSSSQMIEVFNESPLCSPSKLLSTAVLVLPELHTPIRALDRNKSTMEQSPTKVVPDSLPLPFVPSLISDYASLSEIGRPLPLLLRRLLTQQEGERNRFQQLLRCQTKGLQNAFKQARDMTKSRPFTELQREFTDRYNVMCRTLQVQYNSMISVQTKRLRFYSLQEECGSLVGDASMYSLNIPKLSFTLHFFDLYVC